MANMHIGAQPQRFYQTDFVRLPLRVGGYGGFAFHTGDSRLHQHMDFYELAIITQGAFSHQYAGEMSILNRGACLLFSPGVIHRLACQPGQAYHFVLCIEKNFFEDFVTRHFPDRSASTMPPMMQGVLSDESLSYIESLGHRLCNGGGETSAADAILYAVLYEILYVLDADDMFDRYYYVNDIISSLNNPVYLTQTVDELCANYSVSRPTILKNFKKRTGMSIVEYKAQQRLLVAARMLGESKVSITDISSNLGYDSLSYFLRAFKKKYGITPTEYRKQYRK